jgi:tetratricopeptide (TPR) repeat protein
MQNSTSTVQVWEAVVTIPTYPIGKPDKNPMFLEKRVYQGSSGVVYPYPVIDKVYDEKEDQTYKAIFLENRYLKIMLLPEIGGRVQMALDKTNDYHFVYYNRVIKPALVGLTGPWISGGIEFNWPQHHRPSTYEPVDYTIVENADGSKTAWLSEMERMFGTKGMAGFTLYPDKAYLEIKVQLYNRTSLPQTFLWWANPAVHVNDDYQSIFPPDVHAVMDHGKRDVSTFPIATSTYYKVDYAPGTDISRYKNIPVPTSYMAYHSDFDFLGCYDHNKQAGMMHIANHHVVPGKKQWTWGHSDFGKAWDRQLTDEDGPYIELMCGAYTDNQPDFSWIQPGEEKRFTQIFMPYKLTGGAKNANQDAVINLEFIEGTAHIAVYVTSPKTVQVELTASENILFEQTLDLTPETALIHTVVVPANITPQQLTLRVLENGSELIRYTPLSDSPQSIPEPATPAKPPADIASTDELYLNGLHLEQYRHATYEPEAYYLEALRRDPHDSRCNNAMGLMLLRCGKFNEAEHYFRAAINRITRRNPNPYDGEAYYNLGLCLKIQGRYQESFDAFYKATWNAAWQDSAYFELAQLTCRAGKFDEALELVERSLAHNQHHHKAHHLKIALLRHTKNAAIEATIAISLEQDIFNFGALYEKYLLTGNSSYRQLMRDAVHNYIEIALDYAHAGLFAEAVVLLNEAPQTDPMMQYYAGWVQLQTGNVDAASTAFERARQLPPDYCFPQRIDCVPALASAIQHNSQDARAPYYLGNFWYAHRRSVEAIDCWEKARNLDPTFPTVQRNLGLAYVNKKGDLQQGLLAYQRAFELDTNDARVFFELDQLYKKLNEEPLTRLERLEANTNLIEQRDDLTLEYISLLNLLGKHDAALRILQTRRFHPWEGGEGKVTGQYVLSLVELAKARLRSGDAKAAIDYLTQAQTYPPNLGEGKLHGAQENHIFYYLGLAYELANNPEQAQVYFRKASIGLSEPTSAMFYNDQPPDMIFYQGLAWEKLGQAANAQNVFTKLLDYGQTHLNDIVEIDYFAVSLPDFLVFDEDLKKRNQIHCYYMMALGYLGLQDTEIASKNFEQLLLLNRYHIGANLYASLRM